MCGVYSFGVLLSFLLVGSFMTLEMRFCCVKSARFRGKNTKGRATQTSMPATQQTIPSDDTVAKLFLLDHPATNPDVVPEKFNQIYSTIAPHVKSRDVPWGIVLPERLAQNFNKHLEIFTNQVQWLRDNSPYLREVYLPTERYLFSPSSILQPAKVDPVLFDQYLKEDHSRVVQSFEPDSDGFAVLPRYSRVSSVTGRLTVEHGPNILNLKKHHRNMLVSRWGSDGAILGLDYQALEPSMLISLNNSSSFRCSPMSLTTPGEGREEDLVALVGERVGEYERVDPYTKILLGTRLFGNANQGVTGALEKVPATQVSQWRDMVKLVTVSRMNGMQSHALVEKIKSLVKNTACFSAEELVEQVDDVLQLENISKQLYTEWTTKNSCKFIENFYGRPILCDAEAHLINRFFQSSAVDLAMLGFKNIIEYITDTVPDPEEFLWQTMVPIFLLHDMIIFDVNIGKRSSGLTTLNSFARIGSNDLLGFADGSFKLRQSPFIIPMKQT